MARAAARERPPSPNLLRRAIDAFTHALGGRKPKAAELNYQHALATAAAIPEDAIRERLTIGLRTGRVCQLAQRGDAAEAEQVALPLIAMFNTESAKIERLTPNQGALWICYGDALRRLGRNDAAIGIADTFAERCNRLKRFVATSRCDMRALALHALVELVPDGLRRRGSRSRGNWSYRSKE